MTEGAKQTFKEEEHNEVPRNFLHGRSRSSEVPFFSFFLYSFFPFILFCVLLSSFDSLLQTVALASPKIGLNEQTDMLSLHCESRECLEKGKRESRGENVEVCSCSFWGTCRKEKISLHVHQTLDDIDQLA